MKIVYGEEKSCRMTCKGLREYNSERIRRRPMIAFKAFPPNKKLKKSDVNSANLKVNCTQTEVTKYK